MTSLTRRYPQVFVFGEGATRWAFPNPCDPALGEASHEARYYREIAFTPAHAMMLATFVDACRYLLVDCPTTERAIEQLRAIRAAVKEERKRR